MSHHCCHLFLKDKADLKSVDPRTQARLEALLEAAGIGKLSTTDGKKDVASITNAIKNVYF